MDISTVTLILNPDCTCLCFKNQLLWTPHSHLPTILTARSLSTRLSSESSYDVVFFFALVWECRRGQVASNFRHQVSEGQWVSVCEDIWQIQAVCDTLRWVRRGCVVAALSHVNKMGTFASSLWLRMPCVESSPVQSRPNLSGGIQSRMVWSSPV